MEDGSELKDARDKPWGMKRKSTGIVAVIVSHCHGECDCDCDCDRDVVAVGVIKPGDDATLRVDV